MPQKSWLCEVSLKRHVVVTAADFAEAVEKLRLHIARRKVYEVLDQKEEREDTEYSGYVDVFHMKELP